MSARIFVALAGVLLVGAGCALNETPPEGYRWVEEAWSPCDSFYDLVPIEDAPRAPKPPPPYPLPRR